MIDPSQDAFGTALLDYLDGKDVPPLAMEMRGGQTVLALQPEWFFRSYEQWDWWDRKLLPQVEHGPVLDLGPGGPVFARSRPVSYRRRCLTGCC
jgi:hypothetical protein